MGVTNKGSRSPATPLAAARAGSARRRSHGKVPLGQPRRSDQLGVLGHALLRHPRPPVHAAPGSQPRHGQAALVFEEVLDIHGPEASRVVLALGDLRLGHSLSLVLHLGEVLQASSGTAAPDDRRPVQQCAVEARDVLVAGEIDHRQ